MKIIQIDLNSLESILIKYIKEADFEEFAQIAGKVLGGECTYWGDEKFHFYPNENYTEALDNFKDK